MPTCAGPDWGADMTPHLTLPQVMWLVGTAIVVGALLVLIVYGFHKAIRRGLRQEEPKPAASRVSDNAQFMVATLQGVITDLKEQQRKTDEIYRTTEQRATETAWLLETVAQEMGEGLIVFTRDGFVRLANPALRELLALDTWSRRRYPEVFGPESSLAGLVQACLEAGKVTCNARLEFLTARGEVRVLAVSVLPLRASSRETAGAMCLLRAWPVNPAS
jgi:PAS domain-containing protein